MDDELKSVERISDSIQKLSAKRNNMLAFASTIQDMEQFSPHEKELLNTRVEEITAELKEYQKEFESSLESCKRLLTSIRDIIQCRSKVIQEATWLQEEKSLMEVFSESNAQLVAKHKMLSQSLGINTLNE